MSCKERKNPVLCKKGLQKEVKLPQKVFFFMADPNQSCQRDLSLDQIIFLLQPGTSSLGQGKRTSVFVFLACVVQPLEAQKYFVQGLWLTGHPSTVGKSLCWEQIRAR